MFTAHLFFTLLSTILHVLKKCFVHANMNKKKFSFFLKFKPCSASVVLEEDGSTRHPGKVASDWQWETAADLLPWPGDIAKSQSTSTVWAQREFHVVTVSLQCLPKTQSSRSPDHFVCPQKSHCTNKDQLQGKKSLNFFLMTPGEEEVCLWLQCKI